MPLSLEILKSPGCPRHSGREGGAAVGDLDTARARAAARVVLGSEVGASEVRFRLSSLLLGIEAEAATHSAPKSISTLADSKRTASRVAAFGTAGTKL